MRRPTVMLAFALTVLPIGYAAAEADKPNCAPAEQNSGQTLSDKLADSRGVICPPSQLDPAMQKRPPAGGALEVVPPPGSPGGDPKVQPK